MPDQINICNVSNGNSTSRNHSNEKPSKERSSSRNKPTGSFQNTYIADTTNTQPYNIPNYNDNNQRYRTRSTEVRVIRQKLDQIDHSSSLDHNMKEVSDCSNPKDEPNKSETMIQNQKK